MSEADKMFKKLKFEKEDKLDSFGQHKWGETFYNKNNLAEITFDIEDKEICVYCRETDEAVYFDIKLLQAINEKVKELGWLNER